mmetsp:Transcript_61549/g.173591  ORF Transcript_61549/g.173591 Transcript_61549/m.173591 type:complete len:236 (+) Transcript_61549:1284-1991(+)
MALSDRSTYAPLFFTYGKFCTTSGICWSSQSQNCISAESCIGGLRCCSSMCTWPCRTTRTRASQEFSQSKSWRFTSPVSAAPSNCGTGSLNSNSLSYSDGSSMELASGSEGAAALAAASSCICGSCCGSGVDGARGGVGGSLDFVGGSCGGKGGTGGLVCACAWVFCTFRGRSGPGRAASLVRSMTGSPGTPPWAGAPGAGGAKGTAAPGGGAAGSVASPCGALWISSYGSDGAA